MKKLWIRNIAILSLVLTIPASATAVQKSEIVYVNLSAGGRVKNIYVVNRFEADHAETVTDYGVYRRVTNLTDLSELVVGPDTVTADIPAGTFFYQGETFSRTIPWDFSISYRLDGEAVSPGELAGRDGRVEITITIRKSESGDSAFFDNYALSMSVTLDGERYRQIEAEGATIANSGKNRLLTYTVLPGLEKTFTITADATDFEMTAVSINAVPLNIDVKDEVDTTEVKEKVGELQDGIKDIDSGAGKINSAAKKLKSGAGTLYEGSSSVISGIDQIKSGSGQLASSSGEVVTQLNKLSSGIMSLKNASGQIKQAGEKLTSSANTLSSSLSEMESCVNVLKQASGEIGGAISALAKTAGGCSGEISTLNKLLSKGKQNADVRKYLSDELKALETVIGTMQGLSDALNRLDSQYAEFDASVQSVASGISKLSEGAAQLASGLGDYTGPVNRFANSLSGYDAESAAKQYAQFDEGVQKLDAAIDKLKSSYAQLHEGIKSLESGTKKLKSGTGKLAGGTDELRRETGDLDERVDEEVDDALSKFSSDDFEPISFVDERNNVSLVQFVMKTQAIEVPDEPDVSAQADDEEPTSFWDKLMALLPSRA
ncbi:MAG: hypothetical protein VB115_15815 [Christensenellaceae bacterium]|nr:hypothetical protein [Christensenellaceae bacterium]